MKLLKKPERPDHISPAEWEEMEARAERITSNIWVSIRIALILVAIALGWTLVAVGIGISLMFEAFKIMRQPPAHHS